MKNRSPHICFSISLTCLLTVALFSSCIHDDTEDCPLFVSFDYSYNIKNANAFELEAGNVSVWLFDANGKFVKQYEDEGEHINNAYKMNISGLKTGEYTLVAWACGGKHTTRHAGYTFPELEPGISTINDLNIRFDRKEDNISDTEFDPLLMGNCRLNFSNTDPVHCNVKMMKCTNKIRVLLMPVGMDEVDVNRFDFIIEDNNGWLDYRAGKHTDDDITYKPYYTETLRPSDSKRSGDIKGIAVASISISRLFYDSKPRFSIINRESGQEVFVLENLTWYLALLATLEHSNKWSAQEYLDREDYYDITIFVNGDTFMKNKILIKDWVISIDDDINL